jgi:molybdenum cofactor sulfurtransferase
MMCTHTEDGWKRLRLVDKEVVFLVVGPCARCAMVDFDPSTGMKGKTLRALADYRRRNKGQITFGIFLRGVSTREDFFDNDEGVWVQEGELLFCE